MGYYRGPNSVREGLVVHLDPLNPRSYDGVQTDVTDISIEGEQRNSLFVSSGWDPAVIANGSFNFVEDPRTVFYISQPSVTFSTNEAEPTQAFTIEFYLKPTVWTGYLCSPQSRGFDHFVIFSGSQRVSFQTTQGTDFNNRSLSTASGSVPFNEWTHICCTLDGWQKYIYLNGELSAEEDLSLTTTGVANWASNWWFGDRAQIGGNSFEGEMQNIKIYNRALTAEEVKQEYNAHRGRYPNLLMKL